MNEELTMDSCFLQFIRLTFVGCVCDQWIVKDEQTFIEWKQQNKGTKLREIEREKKLREHKKANHSQANGLQFCFPRNCAENWQSIQLSYSISLGFEL